MDVPERLVDWTYDTVVAIVEQHEFEPARFDFKAVLNPTADGGRAEHLTSVRRTTCSMANGSGGYILFGIRDRKAADALPRDRIVGISIASDLRKEFGEKLKTIERGISFDARAFPMPSDSTKCIFVAHVPASSLRPHAVMGTFYIRGEGGSADPMSFMQVRDQMLYTEGRLQKVKLLRMEMVMFRTVCSMIFEPSRWNVRLDPNLFKTLLADVSDLLPPESDLLKLLHDIGTRATLLNPTLDRMDAVRFTHPTGAEAQVRAEVVQQAINDPATLANLCGQAETKLTEIFGPLR